jgi:MOB kinase activator 1
MGAVDFKGRISISHQSRYNFLFKYLLDSEFPRDFQFNVKQLYKQLFRILAHIYHAHYDVIVNLQEEAHLNTLFAHFICFAREFDLIEKKDLVPMNEFIDCLDQMGRI